MGRGEWVRGKGEGDGAGKLVKGEEKQEGGVGKEWGKGRGW